MGNTLIRDVSKVFFSNVIVLVMGLINGFLVPKFLGIDDYAVLKTFALYSSYIGVLHLGFIDGVHIKYGGIDTSLIRKEELKSELLFLLVFEAVIAVASCLIAVIRHDWILIAVSIIIIPTNLITFLNFYYQAIGEFSAYSRINTAVPVFKLVIVLIAIFIIKIYKAEVFIIIQVTVPILVASLLLVKQLIRFKGINADKVISKTNFRMIKIGVFILLGNLATVLFFSLDRWFVKILFDLESFAIYAFAITMVNMVLIFINAIAMVFYPLLVKNHTNSLLIEHSIELLLAIGAVSIGGYFAFELIVMRYLTEYEKSLGIIQYLFLALPAIAVIKTMYVNLYKAKKIERGYARMALLMVCCSLLLNIAAVYINKSVMSIALATTISVYLWLVCSSYSFKGARVTVRNIGFIILAIVSFLFVDASFQSPVMKLIVFELVIISSIVLVYRTSVIWMLKQRMNH